MNHEVAIQIARLICEESTAHHSSYTLGNNYSQLQSQFSEISSLKTLVRARVEQGEERIKFRGTVLLRKPNEIRLETLAPMAAYALNVITVSKQQALSLDIPRKHAVLGPASPEALRRAIGLSLRPSDLILLFAPDLKGLSERCLEPAIECVVFGDATSGNYVIFDTKVAAVFWLDGQFEVSKIELLNAFDESTKFIATPLRLEPETDQNSKRSQN